jgi:hypothetical protein
MTLSLIDSLDLPTLAPTRTRPVVAQNREIVFTDWNWMRSEAAKGGGKADVDKVLLDWSANRAAQLEPFDPKLWTSIRKGMEGFVHDRLYRVTLSEIDDTLASTEPPLAGIGKTESRAFGVNDITSPSPFNLMLHRLLETRDAVPTWQDFERLHRDRPQVFLNWVTWATGHDASVLEEDWRKTALGRAVRYRLATAYNSFIRELHFMTAMRERHGIHLSHHFLLDALWKIDFLHGDTAIELFVNNKDLKTEYGEGRKTACRTANPARNVVQIAIDVRQEEATYNMPWLVGETVTEDLAARLRRRSFTFRGRGTL